MEIKNFIGFCAIIICFYGLPAEYATCNKPDGEADGNDFDQCCAEQFRFCNDFAGGFGKRHTERFHPR